MVNTIYFPGLGIDEFKLRSDAFELFGHPVMWYGIIITVGILSAYLYAMWRGDKNEGISSDDVTDYTIFGVLFGILGARLYYVISKFESYKGETFGETLLSMIAVWEGGLAIYGGIIVGIIAIYITSRVKKQSCIKILDAAAPGVMLAQAIGRWGNFFNGEAYGSVTSLPWRMSGPSFAQDLLYDGVIDTTTCMSIVSGELGVHPTFFYESLWNIIGFVLINIFYKKKKFDGQIVLMYLTWYGFGRFFIEGLRTDSLYLMPNLLGETIKVSQLVAAICFILGITALAVLSKKAKKASKVSDTAHDSDEAAPEEEKLISSDNCTYSLESVNSEELPDCNDVNASEDTQIKTQTEDK